MVTVTCTIVDDIVVLVTGTIVVMIICLLAFVVPVMLVAMVSKLLLVSVGTFVWEDNWDEPVRASH